MDEIFVMSFFQLCCAVIQKSSLPLCLCVQLTDWWWGVGNECFLVKPESCVQ